MSLTRRTFLKNTSLTAALWPLGRLAGAASLTDLADTGGVSSTIHSVCGMCRAGCLIDASVKDGKLLEITGNPNDVLTAGQICQRGEAAAVMPDDPDRLKFPLKRVGKRGEGKWVRISWGEAIDTIFSQLEKRLRQDGPDSLALFHSGSSSSFIKELFVELGCRQINDPSYEYCQANRDLAYDLTFGYDRGGTAGKGVKEGIGFDAAQCVVLIGSNLGENLQVPVMRKYNQALERGAKLIVVDPRRSTAAARADYHLMIRPGTDTALLLGWLKYIIENGLYNRDLDSRFIGLSELKAQLLNYRLADLAAIADISVSELKRSAQVMAGLAPAVFVYPGDNSAWYGNDVQRLRAQAILSAILGAAPADAQGGKDEIKLPELERLASEIIRKAQKGEVKFIGIWGQNPLQAHPNPYRTISALEKVPFTFCCDVYPGEAALYADIILPEASFLERSEIIENKELHPHRLAVRQPVIEPRFEARGPYWIVKQLTSRLGRGRNFGFDSVLERLDHDLRGHGLSWPVLQDKGFGLLPDPVEDLADLFTDSPTIATPIHLSANFPDGEGRALPDFEPVILPPNGFVRLLFGRSPVYSRGLVNNRRLRALMPVNELLLNDQLAREMGIRDGARLFLENQDGLRSLAPIRIKVTADVRVDSVYMAHGFGCRSPFLRAAFNQGVSDTSLLTRSVPDPISGVRGMRVNFIRFVKENGEAWPVPGLDKPPKILLQNSKWWFNSFGAFESGARREYIS
jgi:thiosulfate reductase/polysulfide reductase chain A